MRNFLGTHLSVICLPHPAHSCPPPVTAEAPTFEFDLVAVLAVTWLDLTSIVIFSKIQIQKEKRLLRITFFYTLFNAKRQFFLKKKKISANFSLHEI